MSIIDAELFSLVKRAVREVLAEQRTAPAANEHPTHDAFITRADAAKLASVSKGTIKNWEREGLLTAVQPVPGEKRVARIRRSELEALMAGTKSGDSPPDIGARADVIMMKLKK